MTAVMPMLNAHRVGAPVMLTEQDVQRLRRQIETEHGTADELRRMRDLIGLSLEQRIALRELDNLDFLENGR